MTVALRAPLAWAACVAAALAWVAVSHPVVAIALGCISAAGGALLARASADAPRRILWSSIAASSAGIVARAALPPLPVEPGPLLTVVARAREPLAAALYARVPEPESGILLGIVLGERSSIGRELREAFAATGTTHLLAISGFNMTLVATAVAFGLRGRAAPVLVAAATVAAVGAYSVLVGPAPSVGRAALMAAVGSIALALGRHGLAANALGAAVVAMLVVDPFAVEDVGFILSVAATAGLVAWERPLSGRLAALPPIVRDGLATTLAASAPTIPIVAAVFGRISLVAPLANLVAVPLFVPIMAFGAATAAVGAVHEAAAAPLAVAAYASASALRRWVELCAALPLASVAVPAGPITAVAVALALAAGTLGARVASRRHWRVPRLRAPVQTLHAPIVAAVLVAAIAVTAVATTRSSGTRLHALDVGQGDAFLIESDGRYALIDGGPDGAILLRRLAEVIPPWHRRIDVVVLTHEHADHGNGLLAAIERYDVGVAIEPVGMADVPLTRLWSERLTRSGVPRRPVRAGAVVRVGSVALRVLAPGERRVAVPSLVIRASSGTGSVLFMGDATDDAIADLLLAPDALASRVYVPPHHGADTAHAAALVAAVGPAAAVISSGARNRYGHPTPGTLAALAGVPLYRTDRYGTVVLTLDAHPSVIRTAKAGLPPGRGGPVPRAPAPRRARERARRGSAARGERHREVAEHRPRPDPGSDTARRADGERRRDRDERTVAGAVRCARRTACRGRRERRRAGRCRLHRGVPTGERARARHRRAPRAAQARAREGRCVRRHRPCGRRGGRRREGRADRATLPRPRAAVDQRPRRAERGAP